MKPDEVPRCPECPDEQNLVKGQTVLPCAGGLDEETGEPFSDYWLCVICGHMWPMADTLPLRLLN